MKLKEDLVLVELDDIYYDVFDGGYLKPDRVLQDQEDIDRVNEAIEVMEEYFEFLQENQEEY